MKSQHVQLHAATKAVLAPVGVGTLLAAAGVGIRGDPGTPASKKQQPQWC